MSSIIMLATGDRIVLRRLRTDDLARFQAYRQDAETGLYQSWEVMDDMAATRFLAAMAEAELLQPGEWCQIAIARKDDDRLLGDIGVRLDEDGQAAEVGITISPDCQGNGFAAEAIRLLAGYVFSQTEAGRIYGIADKRNAASIALMHRLGMVFEDEYDTVFEGEPCTEVRYAIRRT